MKILRPEVQKDIVSLTSCSLFDIADNIAKTCYNITEEEYLKILNEATEEEITQFAVVFDDSPESYTFTAYKHGLRVRNKYVEYFNHKL
jgi:hypothetical protein